MAGILAMRRSSSERGPESFGSLWRKYHGSAVHLLTAWAEKFCRTSRQMPGGSASSEQSAWWNQRNARIIPLLLWRTSEDLVLFGPPSTMEGGPRRTRRLRHGLSTEHGTPVFQYLRELGSREILPPDVLRRSESSRRQTAEGGGHMLPWAFANTLRLSNERLLRWSFPLSLI